MKACLVNYCYDPEWLKEYDFDTTMYDRSDDGIVRHLHANWLHKTPNIGDVDYDKLGYLIDNYDNLPEVFLWGKSNLFKYVSEEEFKKVVNNSVFTPLLTMNHRVYSDKWGQVNFYRDNIYWERNDGWLTQAGLDNGGRFTSFDDWCIHFGLPRQSYIPFAPGGNYILTRETVHKHGRDLYAEIRSMLPYAMHPVEAHYAERSYYYLWRN